MKPLLVFLACLPLPAFAAGSGAVGKNLLLIAIVLLAARIFAPLTQRIGFPAVLGELLLGILLGNLALFGFHGFDGMTADPVLAFIGELGVIVLMLQIGLETRLADLVKVGARASLVGCAGIVVPLVLGAYVIGPWLLPGRDSHAHLFLGAALAATSVGIAGRVFRDLGRLGSRAARIVLGAAVIDDVLGLVILAVVSGLVQSGSVSTIEVAWIIAKAVLFLCGSIWLGRKVSPWTSRWLARVDNSQSMLFAQVLATALFLSWLAHAVGLAPIIGAFAAGLLYEPAFLVDFQSPQIVKEIQPLLEEQGGMAENRMGRVLAQHSARQHEHMLEPIGYFFVPVFFVLTGMQVDLRVLADPAILGMALAITLAGILGKLVAGVFAGESDGWLVGWGMVPRGEVGLIFAMVGRQLGVIDESLFAAIVIMVILTTLVTPPVLGRLLRRRLG